MEEAERAFAESVENTVVSRMSLRTMFPDDDVRDLARAAGRGDLQRVDELVGGGVDVNARGTQDAPPLFWAFRNLNGFRRLLEKGADPNAIFADGNSIMRWSVYMEDPTFLELLLEHGGDPNLESDVLLGSPILLASSYGQLTKLRILIEAGADLDIQDPNGRTPLIVAADAAEFEVIHTLLISGADFSIREKNGYSFDEVIGSQRDLLVLDEESLFWLGKVEEWLDEHGVSHAALK
jgi:ankyrin repeat protein